MHEAPEEKTCPGGRGDHFDAIVGDTGYEIVHNLRDGRTLQLTIMRLARGVSTDEIKQGILLLRDPQVTETRITEEWQDALDVLRPELARKMGIAVRTPKGWKPLASTPVVPDTEHWEHLIAEDQPQQSSRPSYRGDSHLEVLRVLVAQWLRDNGPLSIGSLEEITGLSYPTVSKAVRQLSFCLKRYSNRSVELLYFPRTEWSYLIQVSSKIRHTINYVDQSGLPRSAESLLNRFLKINDKNGGPPAVFGIGGVFGAKKYYPDLNITGSPRLDLTAYPVHAVNDIDYFIRQMDSFVRKIDAAMERDGAGEVKPGLVIHILRRSDPLFEQQWADPAECLLDLHEARLEEQAAELLEYLTKQKEKRHER
jgi:hypothetical protein